MTLGLDVGALRRRWYVVVPGLVVAVAAGLATWSAVPPDYERSATQLLLPSQETLPETSSNPFLFLGGLTSVADVIVRAVGSDDVTREITAAHPGSEMAVSRDPRSAGPVILITVTASSDQAAQELIDAAVARSGEVVVELQEEQGIPEDARISITTVTHDRESTLQQRSRVLAAGAAAAGAALLSTLLAAAIDALVRGARRRSRATAAAGGAEPA